MQIYNINIRFSVLGNNTDVPFSSPVSPSFLCPDDRGAVVEVNWAQESCENVTRHQESGALYWTDYCSCHDDPDVVVYCLVYHAGICLLQKQNYTLNKRKKTEAPIRTEDHLLHRYGRVTVQTDWNTKQQEAHIKTYMTWFIYST